MMTTAEVLQLDHLHQMRPYMDQLAAEYKELTGRTVCRSCGSDVNFMILTLKNHHKMSNFQLKKPFASYRMAAGSRVFISNAAMTDQLALDYLAHDPARIILFNKYPENWKELVSEQVPNPQVDLEDSIREMEVEADDDCCDDDTEEPCAECLKAALLKVGMKQLRKQYPEIKEGAAWTKAQLVDAIVEYKLQNQ